MCITITIIIITYLFLSNYVYVIVDGGGICFRDTMLEQSYLLFVVCYFTFLTLLVARGATRHVVIRSFVNSLMYA